MAGNQDRVVDLSQASEPEAKFVATALLGMAAGDELDEALGPEATDHLLEATVEKISEHVRSGKTND